MEGRKQYMIGKLVVWGIGGDDGLVGGWGGGVELGNEKHIPIFSEPHVAINLKDVLLILFAINIMSPW